MFDQITVVGSNTQYERKVVVKEKRVKGAKGLNAHEIAFRDVFQATQANASGIKQIEIDVQREIYEANSSAYQALTCDLPGTTVTVLNIVN